MKSRTGQIERSVANGSPPLRHFFERSRVARRCNEAEMDHANSLHALTYYGECNERFDLIAAVELTVKQGEKVLNHVMSIGKKEQILVLFLLKCMFIRVVQKNFFQVCFSSRGLKGVFWCKNNPCKFFLTLINIYGSRTPPPHFKRAPLNHKIAISH